MTDAVWLLSNRALIAYAKAASAWLLVRVRHDKSQSPLAPVGQYQPDDFEFPKPD